MNKKLVISEFAKMVRNPYKETVWNETKQLIRDKVDDYNNFFRLENEPRMTFAEMLELLREKTTVPENVERVIKDMVAINAERKARKDAELIERNTIK